MLISFFLSKNQKLVNKWHKEHLKIVSLAEGIIECHHKNKLAALKKKLKQLRELTLNHLMDEDIQLYKLLESKRETDKEIEELIVKFDDTFRGIKIALMNFLSKYNSSDSVLDDNFFKSFSEIVKVVVDRIDFEEAIYLKLGKK